VTGEFLTYAVIGFVAQLVDGSIGMAYGVVSTTALLSAGVSPLTATANIHFAELVTGGLSGAFHARRGHVSWPLVRRLVVTGSIGGALGALLLITFTPRFVELVRTLVAAYLMVLGVWLCWRAWTPRVPHQYRAGRASVLGLIGGLFDAAGGGWGPIVTSNLMVAGMPPRVAIGSSIVAEFVVTGVHVMVFAGWGGLRPDIAMAGLLAGGVLATPVAPRLAAQLPSRVIIALVGLAVVVASGLLLIR
jgi:uncharacterized membrane protein YfcA